MIVCFVLLPSSEILHSQLLPAIYRCHFRSQPSRSRRPLREHPEVNSGFNSVSQSIIRFKTVDISIAVSVGAGLITPIVRHADYKNVGQISVEVRALAEKAKAGKLVREEYVGGSFTISNLGMFGVSEFKGIIKSTATINGISRTI